MNKDKSFLKLLIILFLVSILVFIYFSFLTVVTKDSTNYYHYVDIFRGISPLSEWLRVRGPTMPLIIYIFVEIFGDNSLGFLFGTFLFFLISIGSGYVLINNIVKKQENRILKIIIWLSFIILFVFNPSIIGYFHVMITEFVAITIALISCLISINWISLDISKEKMKFIIYSLVFIILSILMWFLKQPYVVVILIPLFLGTFISIIKIKKISNTICKITVFLLSIIFVILSISAWDNILTTNGSLPAKIESEEYLTDGLVRAVSNFRRIKYEDSHNQTFIESSKYIDTKERVLIKEITNGNESFKDYNLYEVLGVFNSYVVDIIVVPDITLGTTSVNDVKVFYYDVLKRYPQQVFSSYVFNYLALIDLIPYDHQNIVPVKRLLGLHELRGENQSIGLAIYFRESTFLGSATYNGNHMRQYEMNNPSNLSSSFLAKLVGMSSLALLTLVLLLSPFLFALFTFIYLFKKKLITEKNTLLFETLIILFGFSFLHVAFHAFTGAIVDRYSFVAYPTSIIGCILLINFISSEKLKNCNKLFRKHS